MSRRLLESLATTTALSDAFSDTSLLHAMLRFEAALARAEASAGVIPAAAADAIGAIASPGSFDTDALASRARDSGTFAIPFIDALRERVRAGDPEAAAFVHFGATSQDAVDTTLVLCLREARRSLDADHARLAAALRALSERHAGSVMLARTLLQPALPTTFGLTVAGWCAAIARSHARLAKAFDEALVLQFGGAAGTLASLGDRGMAVARAMARDLDLALPAAPWHTDRDRLAALVSACGIYTGTLGKMARDVALLMQHEVAEVSEPGGGSSALPHKRNPAAGATILAAATRVPGLVSSFLTAMPQEHQRGVGGWHAEAPVLAAVVEATGAALAAAAGLAESLHVDVERMRANLDATGGLIFAERAMLALAPALGRDVAANRVSTAVDAARRGGATFVEALLGMPDAAAAMPEDVRRTLADPAAYLGSAEELRRRLLAVEDE